MLGEGGIIVESDGLAQREFDAGKDRQHDRNGLGGALPCEPRCECQAGFAPMENEHRPGAFADDEVALPVAGLGSGLDILGLFLDGDAILDRISRRCRTSRQNSGGTTLLLISMREP